MGRQRYLLLTALAASLLATGCCCPPLSGRYCDPCCCPPRTGRCCCPLCVAARCSARVCCPPACQPVECQPTACLPPECAPSRYPQVEDPCPIAPDSSQLASCPDGADCPDFCRKHLPCCDRLHAWFAGFRHGVPTQQHPDYYSPPAKFHPIPTRPAFEPLPSYPPLLPADPGMNNPLRASTDRGPGPTVR
jgi:hypothetical protein